jgi:hypothetical protein
MIEMKDERRIVIKELKQLIREEKVEIVIKKKFLLPCKIKDKPSEEVENILFIFNMYLDIIEKKPVSDLIKYIQTYNQFKKQFKDNRPVGLLKYRNESIKHLLEAIFHNEKIKTEIDLSNLISITINTFKISTKEIIFI